MLKAEKDPIRRTTYAFLFRSGDIPNMAVIETKQKQSLIPKPNCFIGD